MNRYEIRLIGMVVIPGCLFCEQGLRLGEVEAGSRDAAKEIAIGKWSDARESEIHPFLITSLAVQSICSASPVGLV